MVEILSPSSLSRDLRDKHYLYEKFGVPEYFVVDPGNKMVLIYRLEEGSYKETRLMADKGLPLTSIVLPGLSIDMQKVFDRMIPIN